MPLNLLKSEYQLAKPFMILQTSIINFGFPFYQHGIRHHHSSYRAITTGSRSFRVLPSFRNFCTTCRTSSSIFAISNPSAALRCSFVESRSFSNFKPRQPSTSAFPEKKPSYYDDLGVSVDASKDEIHRGFLKLAMLHHPDKKLKNEDESDGDVEFQRIQVAYDVLSDPEKRREYDWRLRGVWRHRPSYDPSEKSPSSDRPESGSQWKQRSQDSYSAASESPRGSNKFHYTAEDLADLKAAEFASHLEFQQQMAKKFREVGRKKESARTEAYKAASVHYHQKIHVKQDDDSPSPPGRFSNMRKALETLKRYLKPSGRQRCVTL